MHTKVLIDYILCWGSCLHIACGCSVCFQTPTRHTEVMWAYSPAPVTVVV
jgi:hypothetical protein